MTSNPNDKAPRPRLKLYIAGGYVFLAAAFAMLAVIPYVRDMRSAQADIERCDSEIAARNDKLRKLDDMQRRIEFIDLQTRTFDRLVPADQDLGPFLTELSQQLDEAGMRDITLTALPPTPLGKSQRLPIEVRGKGTFPQFHEFLVRLEGLKRMSSVGKLAIDADTDMNGMVSAQVMLFIYNTKPGS